MLTPAQLDALSSHIEKNQYVCGEALFPTSSEHILKEVVLHKLAIRCSDPVEKAYYNPGNGKRHSLVVPDICAHCCAKEELKDQEYLESVNKSEGYTTVIMLTSFSNTANDSNRIVIESPEDAIDEVLNLHSVIYET